MDEMAITGLDYWYDAQMRRFLEQIVRAFSGYQYMTGRVGGEDPQLRLVPCRMAHTDRMVAFITKNGSENTLLTVPMICVYQTALSGRRDAVQNLDHVDTRQVIERKIDPDTGKYTGEDGLRYTVDRLMPRPFELSVNVDIWTSNQDQKHQLAEQILTVIYPDFTIQNSDHALDWTAMTTISVEEVNWSSRSIPIGTDNEIDIMTLRLKLPFWLSPPAKVKQQTIIHQIVTNINEGYKDSTGEYVDQGALTRVITTPGGHNVRVENGKITLLNSKSGLYDVSGNIIPWEPLLKKYGEFRPGISIIRFKIDPDLDKSDDDFIGTIEFDANNPNQLFWTLDPDTLPASTQPPIQAVIDPLKSFPGNGLAPAENNQRYLIIHDVGASTMAWGSLVARANDIIQFVNGEWVVDFRPAPEAKEYVVNLYTGRQLRWDGQDWVLSIDGEYLSGFWRLSL